MHLDLGCRSPLPVLSEKALGIDYFTMGHGYKEDDFVVDSSSEEEFISEGEESYQVSSNDGSGSDGSHVASRTRTTDRKPPSMPLEKQKYRARYLKKKYDCGESSSEDE